MVFESGLALEDLVGSNPTEQKQLLHICPDKDNIDHTSYVYVEKTSSQAKPNTQLLSSPTTRQTTPSSQVGLAQPQQAGTSPQQAQEQPGRQAETNRVERVSSLVRDYLGQFKRRSKCYSKSIEMIESSLNVLLYKLAIQN